MAAKYVCNEHHRTKDGTGQIEGQSHLHGVIENYNLRERYTGGEVREDGWIGRWMEETRRNGEGRRRGG